MNPLQKIAPAWHKEAIELLDGNFSKIDDAFTDITTKAVWLGLFLNHIKFRGDKKTGDGSIPHGELGPWMHKNLPAISWNRANTYMRLAKGVCGWGKFQIVDFPQFIEGRQLPPALLKIVEGKTQHQLFLEFKQVKLGPDGEYNTARGNLPGNGGRPPEPKLDIDAIVKFNRESALRNMGRIDDRLGKLGVNFMSQPDNVLLAWLGTLERTQRCVNEWLKTPLARRNRETMELIQKLYRKL
jgi:hypothetical protein